MMLNSAEKDVRILLTLVQQTPFRPEGITEDGLANLQMRVSIWDSTTQIQATVRGLRQLNRSTVVATFAQLILAVALFGASLLLGLMQVGVPEGYPGYLLVPMGMCFGSAASGGFYAILPYRLLRWLATFLLLGAALFTIVLFVLPIPKLPLVPAASPISLPVLNPVPSPSH